MEFFFCKQNTAYEMRISDWSSGVCSSDLLAVFGVRPDLARQREEGETLGEIDLGRRQPLGQRGALRLVVALGLAEPQVDAEGALAERDILAGLGVAAENLGVGQVDAVVFLVARHRERAGVARSEEHTSELQALMRR